MRAIIEAALKRRGVSLDLSTRAAAYAMGRLERLAAGEPGSWSYQQAGAQGPKNEVVKVDKALDALERAVAKCRRAAGQQTKSDEINQAEHFFRLVDQLADGQPEEWLSVLRIAVDGARDIGRPKPASRPELLSYDAFVFELGAILQSHGEPIEFAKNGTTFEGAFIAFVEECNEGLPRDIRLPKTSKPADFSSRIYTAMIRRGVAVPGDKVSALQHFDKTPSGMHPLAGAAIGVDWSDTGVIAGDDRPGAEDSKVKIPPSLSMLRLTAPRQN